MPKYRHHFEGMKKEKPASIDNLTVVFKEYLVQKLAEKKVGFNFLHPVIYQASVPVKACKQLPDDLVRPISCTGVKMPIG